MQDKYNGGVYTAVKKSSSHYEDGDVMDLAGMKTSAECAAEESVSGLTEIKQTPVHHLAKGPESSLSILQTDNPRNTTDAKKKRS
jgi:hypothetical protein